MLSLTGPLCRTSVFLLCVGLSVATAVHAEDPPVFMGAWGGQGADPGEFLDPVDVAVDGLGNVYVTDFPGHRITKFDASGTFITRWSGAGTPTAIALRQSRIV